MSAKRSRCFDIQLKVRNRIETVPKKAQNNLEFRAEIHYNFTVPS